MDAIINYSDQDLELQFGLFGSKLKFYRRIEKKCTRYSLGNEFLEFLLSDKHCLDVQKICFGAYFNPENKKIKTSLSTIQEILFYYDRLSKKYPNDVSERFLKVAFKECVSKEYMEQCIQCLNEATCYLWNDISSLELQDIFDAFCPKKIKYFNYDLYQWFIKNISLKTLILDVNFPEESSASDFTPFLINWGGRLNRCSKQNYQDVFNLVKTNLSFIAEHQEGLFINDYYISYFDVDITRMTFDFKVDLYNEFGSVPKDQLLTEFENRYGSYEECFIQDNKKTVLSQLIQHFSNDYFTKKSNQYFYYEDTVTYSSRNQEIDFLKNKFDFVIRIDEPFYSMKIYRNDHNYQFAFYSFRETVIDPESSSSYKVYGKKMSNRFKIWFDDHQCCSPFLIIGKNNSKMFPLNLKQISQYSQNHPLANEFFKIYFKLLSQDHYIFKDLIRFQYSNMYGSKFFSLLPISVFELAQAHHPKELFCQKYKTASKVPIPWNRLDLNLSYLLMKSLSILEPNDWQKIIRFACTIKDMELILYNLRHARTKEYCFYLPTWFYYNQFKDSVEDLNDLWYEISDSFLMAYKLRESFSLQYRSIRRLVDEHDHLANRIREKEAYGKVKIPKNSKFKKLEKLLPKENFEWIKSGVRLRKEGEEQDNCVFSYAGFINRDRCAIYSANIGKNRYTIEFHKNKESQYVIAQMKRSHNRKAFIKDIEYVQSFLS